MKNASCSVPAEPNSVNQENKPVRVQLSRKKGWRMPENTVKVTRPGKWGNPFKIGEWCMVGDPDPRAVFRMSWCMARDKEVADKTPGKFTFIDSPSLSVEFFKRLVANGYFRRDIPELRGKSLACWCRIGDPCHADVLLEIANSEGAK